MESISFNHAFDFYPPSNSVQLLILRLMRLFLPSRHSLLQRLKFSLLRMTHWPFVLGITLFEQIFCHQNTAIRSVSEVLHPPSSRSARVAANRLNQYPQLLPKIDASGLEEVWGVGTVEFRDMQSRLRRMEGDMALVRTLLERLCHGGLRHRLWRLRILVELSCCKLKKIYVRYENFVYIGWTPVLGLPGLAGLSFMTGW